MSYDSIVRDYHIIDNTFFNGRRFDMYEDNEYGDTEPAIVTDGNIFVYTWESLDYTLENLNEEYTIYHLD